MRGKQSLCLRLLELGDGLEAGVALQISQYASENREPFM